jgi:hypothetical protein
MSDAENFYLVGTAVQAREGWIYEPATTPEAQSSWCGDPGGVVAVSVTVVDGAVGAYLPSADREVQLYGIGELVDWLDANEERTAPA